MDRDRKSIVKSIGAGSIGLMSTTAVASGDVGHSAAHDLELPGVEVDNPKNPIKQLYRQVLSSESGERMVNFLQSRDYVIDQDRLSANEISIDDGYDHTMVSAPIASGGVSIETTNVVVFRIFEQGVSAHTIVDGQAYGTIPSIDEAPRSLSIGTDSIARLSEIRQQADSLGEINPEWSISCMASGTFDAAGPACTFLQGLAGILASVLVIVPEPGSTLTGTAALSGILAGSCTIGQAVEEATGCSSVFEVGICVGYPLPWNPAPVRAYPASGWGC